MSKFQWCMVILNALWFAMVITSVLVSHSERSKRVELEQKLSDCKDVGKMSRIEWNGNDTIYVDTTGLMGNYKYSFVLDRQQEIRIAIDSIIQAQNNIAVLLGREIDTVYIPNHCLYSTEYVVLVCPVGACCASIKGSPVDLVP